MSTLELDQVAVDIGTINIVRDISLFLGDGDIGCLLGPSGCGKTTLLRGIAGFERVSAGELRLDGNTIANPTISVPVADRQVGMVFQDYALFPHLTIEENIGFGLQKSDDSALRVLEVASLLGIEALLASHPHEVSGGQQQRVAVARAMAPSPRLLLLDEPFASLDVELREQVALDIREVLKRENTTALMVTHNQQEAFAMADIVGVMRAGSLLQWDTAVNIYHAPAHPEVARFVGEGQLVEARVVQPGRIELGRGYHISTSDTGPTGDIEVLIRPDDISIHEQGEPNATVESAVFRGTEFIYKLSFDAGFTMNVIDRRRQRLNDKERVCAQIKLNHLVAFPRRK